MGPNLHILRDTGWLCEYQIASKSSCMTEIQMISCINIQEALHVTTLANLSEVGIQKLPNRRTKASLKTRRQ